MDIMHHIHDITNIQPADIGETIYIMGRGGKTFIALALSHDHIETLSIERAENLAHDILNTCEHIRSTQNQAKVTKRTAIGIAINNPRF